MSSKKALKWVIFWILLAMAFDLGVYFFLGQGKAIEFLGGYVIEKSLSLDNLFLFVLVFTSFGIKEQYQRRILNYGLIGALILRLIFVLLGVAVVTKFSWILYIFGVILIFSGLKMIFKSEEQKDLKDSKLISLLNKLIPVTDSLFGDKFFVRKNRILYATPLLAILVLIEGTDILFAIDSIPAIFSISTDPFIVYTSNIFAILGMRSLYFLLASINDSFKYVKYGVAVILMFTGIKLLLLMFHIHIPVAASVGIIFMILLASILISVIISKRELKSKESLDREAV